MSQAVAARYARALADAVLAPGMPQASGTESLEQLRSFHALVQDSPELKNVLLSPAVTATRKKAVIARFAESMALSKLVRNLLYVMVDRRRAGMLGEVGDAFEAVLDERLGIVRAQVTSAAPLPESQQTALQQELSRVAGKQVRCDFALDPSLIGGVVARIGSTVYDGSVRTQLEQLREQLVTH